MLVAGFVGFHACVGGMGVEALALNNNLSLGPMALHLGAAELTTSFTIAAHTPNLRTSALNTPNFRLAAPAQILPPPKGGSNHQHRLLPEGAT